MLNDVCSEVIQNEEAEPNDEGFFDNAVKQVFSTGSITVRKNGKLIHCITIIGQIEGHYLASQQTKTTKYEHIIPQLVAVEESDEIDGLFLILNTVGGDIEAGLAIAELISGMKTPSVSLVLGGGHSIGVPLAVAADKSFIVPSATMTVHPVRTNGLVIGVPQMLEYFLQMQERIVSFVCTNSDIDDKTFRKLMLETGELVTDVGTILGGSDAVKYGLIDKIGSLSDALEELDRIITERRKSDGAVKHKKETRQQHKKSTAEETGGDSVKKKRANKTSKFEE